MLRLRQGRARQPPAQFVGGLIGRGAIEGHDGGRGPRRPSDLRAPAVATDEQHLDDIGTAINRLLEADSLHGVWILTIASRYTSEAPCEAAPGVNRAHDSLASS